MRTQFPKYICTIKYNKLVLVEFILAQGGIQFTANVIKINKINLNGCAAGVAAAPHSFAVIFVIIWEPGSAAVTSV